MAETSKIQWTDSTFNPWEGCSKVSPGCQNCYAEARANRWKSVQWGPHGTRRVAAESKWEEPFKWSRDAAAAGERRRVFCASLADVFEDWKGPMVNAKGDVLWHKSGAIVRAGQTTPALVLGERPATMNDVRTLLWQTIDATPNLDWLLLTKRPENVLRFVYDAWCKRVPGHVSQNEGDGRRWHFPPNVWLGVSVEDQQRADERIPILLSIPAALRFLSIEPQLGPVDLTRVDGKREGKFNAFTGRLDHWKGVRVHPKGIDWVIVGGESGPGARPFDLAWARSLRDQCAAARVAFFMKQAGARPYTMEQDPTYACEHEEERTLRLLDRKGGDLAELPEDLRVRQFPRAAVRACRVCRCTDADCSGCIARTGEPCHWVEADLCSACV